ncbi:MAG TPA: uracil phosphoribosyltransferase, partial [Allosphingosinicella sp.]|nr:uracil phosphoribosyltransferase [Allosphingosinicella sp.]
MDGLTIVSHPLVQHKLTLLRDRNSSIQLFRSVVREIATLLCYEVTRDLPTDLVTVETPIATTEAPAIAGKKLVIAPILRAGLAMAEGMLDLLPSARVAHIGLYREPVSLQCVEYYFKTPEDCAERLVIIVDPMMATGHTAIAAIDRLKEAGVADMRFVCLLCYEVTRDLPTEPVRIETPITVADVPAIRGKKLVFAPVMRAGLAMAEGMLDLVPSARVAHIGLYREPVSLQCV